MNGNEALICAMSPLQDRIREADKIAARLRIQILGEFAHRLNEASNLDDARKMLTDEIEAQREIAGDSKRRT